jgi:D-alanyl-D-alanine carboxypeptidase/D-alanyl-D-alanine-endopeptidase (penicillin-binding protein 4)
MPAATAFRRTLLLIAAVAAPAGTAAAAEPPFNAAVRGLVARAKLGDARAGVSAVEVKSGRILCSVNDKKLLIPASNVKLITTGAALALLGADFEFKTRLYARGTVTEDQVLRGDLVVVAGGDPAISGREHKGRTTAVFDAWAAKIARSVRRVKGDLVIDDTIFDRVYVHPSWPEDQLIRWYCAPVSAFALNDNCIDVAVRPGARPGEPARVILDPPTGYVKVVNRCRTVASGRSRAVIHRLPGSDTTVVSGKLTPGSKGATSPVAVHRPVRYAAAVLRERLARGGVRVDGRIVLADKPCKVEAAALLASSSHSLTSCIRTANKRSQNFYAEMMLKTLGRRRAARASFADGVKVVAGLLKKVGIPPGTYTMVDGSGMSRKNRFSALQLAVFLRYMALSPHAAAFARSLPESGVDGTLKRRLGKPAYAGKVRAKTGHLSGVSALSGYLEAGGKKIAFSILVNGFRGGSGRADRLQDAVCRHLVEELR